jgi:hypothetical protein
MRSKVEEQQRVKRQGVGHIVNYGYPEVGVEGAPVALLVVAGSIEHHGEDGKHRLQEHKLERIALGHTDEVPINLQRGLEEREVKRPVFFEGIVSMQVWTVGSLTRGGGRGR